MTDSARPVHTPGPGRNHGHGHGHGGHDMASPDFDWGAMADHIEAEGRALGPYPVTALASPALTPERILDIGSGPGVAARAWARAYPDAEVVAVDGSAELVALAAERAAAEGLSIGTRVASFPEDLRALPAADLVWSSQVVHHLGDQVGALGALAEVVRPGGTIAIGEGGLSPRWLPRDLGFGRPGLQFRLDALMAERFQDMRDALPGAVRTVEDWPAMLHAAGFVDARTINVLIDRPADDDVRAWVRWTLARFLDAPDDAAGGLAAEDRATLERLVDPSDPESVDRRADLHVLAVRSIHVARRPDRQAR